MLKLLTTFKTVYETRSFSQAAQLLFISQPTVSAQIKQLEAEFGDQLFVRNGRGELGVTPAATTLYAGAGKMLAEWDTLHHALRTHTPDRRPCRLAVSHTFSLYVLPALLPGLAARFPQLDFSVTVANSQAVQTALTTHNADLGFIEKPLVATGLRRWPLLNDELVHVGADDEPWLVREADSGVNYYTRRYFAENNVQERQLEIASNALIIALLHHGFGQAIISKRATEGLEWRPLGENYARHFYLLTRSEDEQGVIGTCAKEIREWAQAVESLD